MRFTRIETGHYQCGVNETLTINLYKVGYEFVGNETYYDIEINGSYFGQGGKLSETKKLVEEILNNKCLDELLVWFKKWSNPKGDLVRFARVITLINEFRGIDDKLEVVEQVQQINENTFKYKGSKISMYGEASEYNNIAIEGWLILEGSNYEEELSEIYAEGYSTYKEAIKAVFDDLERRAYPHKIQIEEISFI